MANVNASREAGGAEQGSAWQAVEKTISEAIPLPVYQRLARRAVISLVYHTISNESPPHLRHLYPSKTPIDFEQDLIYLQDHYHVISYEELLAHHQGRTRLKPRAVLITFDDGYRECFTEVRPLLKKYQLPAVFFLTTDLVDNRYLFYRNKYSLAVEHIQALTDSELEACWPALRRLAASPLPDRQALLRWLRSLNYLDEETMDQVCKVLKLDPSGYLAAHRPYLTAGEVRSLAADGFTLGAHSRRHPKLDLLDTAARADEILGSCRAVQALTGQETVPFAFPFSGYGVDRRELAGLHSAHPVIGLLFDSKGVRVDRPFIYNRIWADPPPGPGAANSNLGELILAAYQENARWRYRYLMNVIWARLARSSARPQSHP